MNDLTIIMFTPNLVPEGWAKYHKQKLFESAIGAPIITVSAKPLDWGLNLIQDGYGLPNLYKQLLRAAKEAKTEFIGIADDDTLYPKEHFSFRPKKPGFYYNHNRWQIFSWGEPFYFFKPRPGAGCMIANRKLVIEALEARLAADPNLAGHYSVKELGASIRMRGYDRYEYNIFHTKEPIVSISHTKSVDEEHRLMKKQAWPVRTMELPLAGKAEDLRKKFQ